MTRKRIATVLVGVALLACAACAIFLLSSCSFNKYVLAAGLPEPDSAFQTGTIYGYNLYVWECYSGGLPWESREGRRIVLYHYTSEMTSGPFQREEGPCGEETPIERQLLPEKRRDLDPTRFW